MDNVLRNVQLSKFWLAQGKRGLAKALLLDTLNQAPFNHNVIEVLASGWPLETIPYILELSKAPNCPPSIKCILADLYLELDNPSAAIYFYQSALCTLDPSFEVVHNLGLAHAKLFQFKEAVKQFEIASKLNSESFELQMNWGAALANLGFYQKSLQHLSIAEKMEPNDPHIWLNKGVTFEAMNQPEKALDCFNTALKLDPNYIEAYSNKANLMFALGRHKEAFMCYGQALSLEPDDPVTLYNLGSLQLRQGNYELGWKNYENRWGLQNAPKKPFSKIATLRDLDSLRGKTCSVLAWSEQGLGDSIQFCRFLPYLAQIGAHITLAVQKPLIEVLKNLDGIEKIIEAREDIDKPFDFQISLMSLPYLFQNNKVPFPNNTPYLSANPAKVSFWKKRLCKIKSLRVGLVWSGGFRPNQPESWVVNQRRNIPLELIAKLKDIPKVQFISLQKGDPAESELLSKRKVLWPEDNLHIFNDELGTFEDTAAIIENLDLVISVDTSTAHLTGALKRPLWLLNRFDSCWRWEIGKDKTQWYESVKIFNQPNFGDWLSVINDVKRELIALSSNHNL